MTDGVVQRDSEDDPELMAAIAESLQPSGPAAALAAAAEAAPARREADGAQSAPPARGGPPCELSVRLPNNQRLLAEFTLQATVGDVLAWLEGRGWSSQSHRLCVSFPRVPLLERSASLSDVGLRGPREVLLLERC